MQQPKSRIFTLGAGSSTSALREGALAFRGQKALPPSVRLLADALPGKPPGRVLLLRDPAGVLAMTARWLWRDAPVDVHHFDAYEAACAAANLAANGVDGVSMQLLADPPRGPFDLIAFPCPGRGEALLTRELIEAAHAALEMDGRLLVSTDGNPSWLRKAVKEIFGREDLQVYDRKRGAAVASRRRREQARMPDHSHVLQIPFRERKLAVRTRPGVFSYGRLDRGTGALLQCLDVESGQRVLDLGCGAGVLGLAAACCTDPGSVVLVDSNARATALAAENARANGAGAAAVLLRADLEDIPGPPFDRVLANPPYFSRGRIADAFTRAAVRHLAPDGVYQLVAKAVDVHRSILQPWFRSVLVDELDGYGIFNCRHPVEAAP